MFDFKLGSVTRNKLIAFFLLLSALDVVLTSIFLSMGESAIEANPVAAHYLGMYGIAGLAGFKGVVVICVVGLCHVIGRYRPPAALAVYGFGCCVLTLVNTYTLGRVLRAVLQG
jgi:hypothetical protein